MRDNNNASIRTTLKALSAVMPFALLLACGFTASAQEKPKDTSTQGAPVTPTVPSQPPSPTPTPPSLPPTTSSLPVVPTPPPKKDRPTLIVFNLVNEKGIDKGEANLLTEIVIDRVSMLKKYSVIGQKDLDKMLSWEQTKQLQGCTDTSCLIQIAGALGASFYVEGSLGVMGNQYIVTLKLMDAANVKVIERVTEPVMRDEEHVVKAMGPIVEVVMGVRSKDTLSEAIAKLVVKKPEPKAELSTTAKVAVEEPGFNYRKFGMGACFTGIGVAAIGGLFTYLADQSNADLVKGTDPYAMKDSRDKIGLYNNVAVGMYATGGALAVGGALLWAFGSDGKPSGVTLRPSASTNGYALVLAGGW